MEADWLGKPFLVIRKYPPRYREFPSLYTKPPLIKLTLLKRESYS